MWWALRILKKHLSYLAWYVVPQCENKELSKKRDNPTLYVCSFYFTDDFIKITTG